MAYENIRFRRQNLTVVNNYFWMVDEESNSIIVKTDDGSVAFSYPFDTSISTIVKSLEYDGHNVWTLEQTTTNTLRVRRWEIRNYICEVRDTFNYIPSSTHLYKSDAMTIEHYHTKFSATESVGQTILSVEDGSMMSSGNRLFLGPNHLGQREMVTVNTATTDSVTINGTIKYAYDVGDAVSFYKRIWIFNDYNGVEPTGALYCFDAYTGAYINRYPGGSFHGIGACTFFDIPKYVFDKSTSLTEPRYNSICFIKGTNMIFLNPYDLNNSFGSMTMDNIEQNQATLIPVFDIAIDGSNVYRLQRKATYYGSTTTFADNTYNYQLSTLNSFITSISMKSEPAIIPANGINNATVTITIKDQFGLPVPYKPVYVTDDDVDGAIINAWPATDKDGVATTIYRAGYTAREVRITATAQQT